MEINSKHHALMGIAYAVWEFWLGRTKSLQAGSSVELVINIVKFIWRKIWKTQEQLEK